MGTMFIDKIAAECDNAINNKNIEQIDLMLNKLSKLETENAENPTAIAHILYCISNLYTEKAKLTKEFVGNWRNGQFPEYNIMGLNYLRKAENKINRNSYPYNPLEIQTNIGNSLNSFCRVVEAIKYWTFNYDFKQKNDANFVAPFAKAKTLNWLAKFLNDPGHSYYYNMEAYKLLNSLYNCKENILHNGIKNDLTTNQEITELLQWGKEESPNIKPFKELSANIKYDTNEELQYRKWCLKNTLFLNPMNDITTELMAAKDILQFPNYIVDIGEGPFYSAAFSDIKNRFCKARFLAYNGFKKEYPT